MEIKSLSNCTCLYTTDFQSHRKSNAYISHLNYVPLYETLKLEMTAHFQNVTETGPSLKQLLRYIHCSTYLKNTACFAIDYNTNALIVRLVARVGLIRQNMLVL